MVLRFEDVIDLRILPMNVEGLSEYRYPVHPWMFNEIIDGEEVANWKALNPRLWLISFNDVLIEILFGAVSLLIHDRGGRPPQRTLMNVLRDRLDPAF